MTVAQTPPPVVRPHTVPKTAGPSASSNSNTTTTTTNNNNLLPHAQQPAQQQHAQQQQHAPFFPLARVPAHALHSVSVAGFDKCDALAVSAERLDAAGGHAAHAAHAAHTTLASAGTGTGPTSDRLPPMLSGERHGSVGRSVSIKSLSLPSPAQAMLSALRASVWYTVHVTPLPSASTSASASASASALSSPYTIQRRYEDFAALHSALADELQRDLDDACMAASPSAVPPWLAVSATPAASAPSSAPSSASAHAAPGAPLLTQPARQSPSSPVRLPSLPRRRIFASSAVCAERVLQLDAYAKQLLALPPSVTQRPLVAEFFGLWVHDLAALTRLERHHSDGVVGPLLLHQRQHRPLEHPPHSLYPLRSAASAPLLPSLSDPDYVPNLNIGDNTLLGIDSDGDDASLSLHDVATGTTSSGLEEVLMLLDTFELGTSSNRKSGVALDATFVAHQHAASLDRLPSSLHHSSSEEQLRRERDAADAPLDEDWLRPIEQRRTMLFHQMLTLTDPSDPSSAVAPSSSGLQPLQPRKNSGTSGSTSQPRPHITTAVPAASNDAPAGTDDDDMPMPPSPKETYEQFVTTLARKLGITSQNMAEYTERVSTPSDVGSSTRTAADEALLPPPVPSKDGLQPLMSAAIAASVSRPADLSIPPIPPRKSSIAPRGPLSAVPPSSAGASAATVLQVPVVPLSQPPTPTSAIPPSRPYTRPLNTGSATMRRPPGGLSALKSPTLAPTSAPASATLPRSFAVRPSGTSPADATDVGQLGYRGAPSPLPSPSIPPRLHSHNWGSRAGTPVVGDSGSGNSDRDGLTTPRPTLSVQTKGQQAETATETAAAESAAEMTAEQKYFAAVARQANPSPPALASAATRIDYFSTRAAMASASKSTSTPTSASKSTSTLPASPAPVVATNPLTTLVRKMSRKRSKKDVGAGDADGAPGAEPLAVVPVPVPVPVPVEEVAPWNRDAEEPAETMTSPVGTLMRSLSLKRRGSSRRRAGAGATTGAGAAAGANEPGVQDASKEEADDMARAMPASPMASVPVAIKVGGSVVSDPASATSATSASSPLSPRADRTAFVSALRTATLRRVGGGGGGGGGLDSAPTSVTNTRHDQLRTLSILPQDSPIDGTAAIALARSRSRGRQVARRGTRTGTYGDDLATSSNHSHAHAHAGSTLFRSHTIAAASSSAEIQRHFVHIRAVAVTSTLSTAATAATTTTHLESPPVLSFKASTSVELGGLLDKIAARFASHAEAPAGWRRFDSPESGQRVVAIAGLTYKDVDGHVISVLDEEDWRLCLEDGVASRGRVTLYVQIETDDGV